MSGHNKWSTIKHKKAKEDAKRGRVFTRLARELQVAARMGGGDPGGNPRLRSAITAARAANMPGDNVERAIKKGTGELEGLTYEEIVYEGYGPGGVAVLVETVTDNRVRTIADVRHLFTKNGGAIAEMGAVAWQFERIGQIVVDPKGRDEDELLMAALDAGASDVVSGDDGTVVITAPEALFGVLKALEDQGITTRDAELTYQAKTPTPVPEDRVAAVMKLLDALDDYDDVQKVHSNADFPEGSFEE